MRFSKAVIVALLAIFVIVAVGSKHATRDYRSLFEGFKAKHGKKYPTKTVENARFDVFVENMLKAEGLGASNPLASFGVNAFSDLTQSEFRRTHHNGRDHYAARPAVEGEDTTTGVSAGQKIDWREKGAVTAVKNQGQCGSCWAFSSTGNIEGQHFIKNHELVSLSEQELVSCDTLCDGCNGGLMDSAFEWLIHAKGGEIDTEASYPYVSGNGVAPTCKANGHTAGAKVTSYKNIAHNENAIADYLFANGPVSIAVDATSWQTYTGGIMTNCISQQVDHGVLAVGFDDAHNPPYWIIKNSWAASWGEDGYIRVEKGKDQCLITSYPCSAIVA